MSIEPIVFFDLVFAIFVLSAVLALIAISYVKTVGKFQSHGINEGVMMVKDDIKSDSYKKATEIIEDAQANALKIIANAKSLESQTQNQLYDEIKAVSLAKIKTFEKASLELLKKYVQELEDLKVKNIEIVKNISNNIESNSLAQLKDFQEILKKETFASQKIVEGKIEKDYEDAQKEIQVYKEEKLKKIDDQIYELIKNISILVLGKSLTLTEHEELIIDALNKAKQEGMLG